MPGVVDMHSNPVNYSHIVDRAERVVIKIGSAVLTDENGLDTELIHELCGQMANLMDRGRHLMIVSSGAIAAGMGRMPERSSPRAVPEKQALAAIGQGLLMQVYEEAFERFGYRVAQVLLTRDGLIPRRRYVNAKNTIKTLMDWNVIPIINENDTVATDEIQFTDNDALSVLVVNLAEADLLVSLSDIDGLYNKDPRENPDAHKIELVESVDEEILAVAGEGHGRAGRGGMKSKLNAARMVTSCGIPMIVAGGKVPKVIDRLFAGEMIGTLFLTGGRRRIYGRRSWIAFALEKKGSITIDEGAAMALLDRGKSLLPVGIKEVSGEFDIGDCVVCVDIDGNEIALGLSNYSSEELKKITGRHTKEVGGIIGRDSAKGEVIHRNNMVMLR
jgi:glutamate 5-kinase